MPELPLKYLVREPGEGHDGSSAPTLVLLHGLRSNEEDLIGLAPELDPRLRVVSVRAPVELERYAYAWYPVEFLPGGSFHADVEIARRSLDDLMRFLHSLPEEIGADPRNLYCGGFSQGAIMTIAAVNQDPALFAGIVCMSGRMPPIPAPSTNLRNLPAIVVHGTEDPVIPIRYGYEIRDYLTQAGANLTWREYAMGHYVSAASLRDIRNWLSMRLDSKEDWRRSE